MVLLVVDAQRIITTERLYEFKRFVENVEKMIDEARTNHIEVIYIRHDDGAGSELTKGTEGYEIYDKFQPQKGEKIFDKEVNSAFKESGLLEYLENKNERDIIIVGLQTDYCIDATIKCGFEHGLHMIVPAYTNTTLDNKFMTAKQSYEYYNEHMWPRRYAECITVEAVIEKMRSAK